MYRSRYFWQYGLFQIPALLLLACLVAAGVVAILRLGCPNLLVWLFLGLAWISFMWMLVLPLDVALRTKLNLKMGLAGRIAIAHAVSWSLLTLAVLLLMLPSLMKSCNSSALQPVTPVESPTSAMPPSPSSSLPPVPSSTKTPAVDQELISLDWAEWRANIWNEMFLKQKLPGKPGSTAKFSFAVYRDGHIEDVKVEATDPQLKAFVEYRIDSLLGTKALVFIKSTRRNKVFYESSVTLCTPSNPGCGKPADPGDYPDLEEYTRSRL